MRNWNPQRIQCLDCLQIVFSSYPGEFAACTCLGGDDPTKGIFIDETRDYTRVGGTRFRPVPPEENAN